MYIGSFSCAAVLRSPTEAGKVLRDVEEVFGDFPNRGEMTLQFDRISFAIAAKLGRLLESASQPLKKKV